MDPSGRAHQVTTWVRAHRAVLPYAVLCVFLAGAFWQAHQTSLEICKSDAETRQAVIDFVNIQAVDTPIPPDASPEIRATLENANRRRAEYRSLTRDLFTPKECGDGFKPTPRAPAPTTTSTTPPTTR